MRLTCLLAMATLLVITCPAAAYESTEYRLRDDFGMEPLYDCYMNYYYYAPCPTYAWFWSIKGWEHGDIVGKWFQVGDISTATGQACDPAECHTLDQIRVLNFNGYGAGHGCMWCVDFDVYCCDEQGCPIGPPLWSRGPWKLDFAWQYIPVDPPICLTGCSVNPGSPQSAPRILVTATHTGTDPTFPEWGFDNISYMVETGCEFHDYSCLPALYPRPYNSFYPTMHSGYYGQNFGYSPPLWFPDQRDTTPSAIMYGHVELAWRIYLTCSGPTNVEPTTWGNIKSMYR